MPQLAWRYEASNRACCLQWAQRASKHENIASPSMLQQGILERLHAAGCNVDYAEVTVQMLPSAHVVWHQGPSEPKCSMLQQVVDAETLQPVRNVQNQPTLVAVAAVFGDVRLIDNILLNMKGDSGCQ